MLIIRRLNCIDAASGIVTLSRCPSGAPVHRCKKDRVIYSLSIAQYRVMCIQHCTISRYVYSSSHNIALCVFIIAQYRVVCIQHRTISRCVYSSSHNIVLFAIIVTHALFSHHRTIPCYLQSSHNTVLCTVIIVQYRVMYNFPRPTLRVPLTSMKAGKIYMRKIVR